MIGFTTSKISSRFTFHTCYARHSNKNRDRFKENDDNENQNKKNQYFDKNVSYLLFETKMTGIENRGTPISLYDVRDAMECCCMIKNDEKRYECYHQFGVDGKMAEKYFKYVERLEREYKKSEEHLKHKKQTMPFKNDKKTLRKWFHFDIFGDQ